MSACGLKKNPVLCTHSSWRTKLTATKLFVFVLFVALKKRIPSKFCILSCFVELNSIFVQPFVCFWSHSTCFCCCFVVVLFSGRRLWVPWVTTHHWHACPTSTRSCSTTSNSSLLRSQTRPSTPSGRRSWCHWSVPTLLFWRRFPPLI